MNQKELNQWKMLANQVKNGYHLSNQDKTDLLRLNHQVMKISHDIHNKNMLNNLD